MSITITKRDRPACPEKPTFSRDLLKGTVFKYNDGVTGLRLQDGCVLLKYTDGIDWLSSEGCYSAEPVAIVLGRIVEIIVE